MSLTRRDILVGGAGAAVGLLGGLTGWRVAMAATPVAAAASRDASDARLVLIILRGGLDGLAAFPRPGDAQWRALGRDTEAKVNLSDGFALHPGLASLAPWWTEGALALVPAAGQPAATRSHFDAQDLLEEGGAKLGDVQDGWLRRALDTLGMGSAATAIGTGVPLVLRDKKGAGASSVDPGRESRLDDALARELSRLWAGDGTLEAALGEAMRAHAAADGMTTKDAGGDGLAAEATGAGRLLGPGGGYRVAVLDNAGWDTHAGQAARLERQLGDLAAALAGLRAGVGELWPRTAILVTTAFGRTARPNGTTGTDHGTAGPLLLAGGAIRGGRVVGDWPGLVELHEGRDLRVATDVRAVFKGVLRDHLGVDAARLEREVFPGSAGVSALGGLTR